MADENTKPKENKEVLEDTLGKTEFFYNNNKSLINKVLIGLILVLGSYIVLKKMVWEPNETAAQESLWEAQYVFEKDSFAAATELFQGIIDEFSGN